MAEDRKSPGTSSVFVLTPALAPQSPEGLLGSDLPADEASETESTRLTCLRGIAVAAPSSPSDPQQQKDHEVSNTSADAAASAPDPPPTVRFSSAVEEIDPTEPVVSFKDSALGEVTSDEIKAIANSFHATPLQGRRMSNFAFEVLPLSLPASRVRDSPISAALPRRLFSLIDIRLKRNSDYCFGSGSYQYPLLVWRMSAGWGMGGEKWRGSRTAKERKQRQRRRRWQTGT